MGLFDRLRGFFQPKVPVAALAQMEELLVVEIPKAVRSASITEPAYCLRLWYNGTDSAEDAVPWLMLVKESTRQEFLAKHGANAPYYLWSADEATLPGQSYNINLPEKPLQRPYSKWYRYICKVEDDEELQHFREMMQRVARRLNQLRWQDLAPVTDDFVVFPADGSHTFCDDIGDLKASISPEQLASFRAKNLLPPEEDDAEEENSDSD